MTKLYDSGSLGFQQEIQLRELFVIIEATKKREKRLEGEDEGTFGRILTLKVNSHVLSSSSLIIFDL
jgi:hypothetical protein